MRGLLIGTLIIAAAALAFVAYQSSHGVVIF